jgi:hypothetical protein
VSWQQITCEERDALVDELGRSYNGFSKGSGVGVLSSLTDVSGTYGEPYVLTEWGYTDTDVLVLKDERWPESDRPCVHSRWLASS